jgi:hypothetical protein
MVGIRTPAGHQKIFAQLATNFRHRDGTSLTGLQEYKPKLASSAHQTSASSYQFSVHSFAASALGSTGMGAASGPW